VKDEKDLTPLDMNILITIGKIKRQKQKPSFERIFNILKSSSTSPNLDSPDAVSRVLDQAYEKGIISKIFNDLGILSYKESGIGVSIVSDITKRKTNVLLLEESKSETQKVTKVAKIKSKSTKTVQTRKNGKLNTKKLSKKSPLANKAKAIATSTQSSLSTVYNNTKSSEANRSLTACSKPPNLKSFSSQSGSPTNKRKSSPESTSKNRNQNRKSKTTQSEDRQKEVDIQTNHFPIKKPLLCGICREDSSKGELITCSICGLSGKSLF